MGVPKASLEWHGSTLVRRIAGLVERAVDGPVVVVRAVDQALPVLPSRFEVVEDIEPDAGPMAGIVAGLLAVGARAQTSFVAATDLALIRPALVRAVVESLTDGYDLSVPETGKRLHLLAAAYSARVIPVAQSMLAGSDRRLSDLVATCSTRIVGEAELLADARLAADDPKLMSLTNLNDVDAYRTAVDLPLPLVTVCRVGPPDRPGNVARSDVRAATLGAAIREAALFSAGMSFVRINGAPAPLEDDEPLVDGDVVELG